MPYNVRLKKYKNGTFQLTYYHRAIRTKDDYWRPYNLPDLHTTDMMMRMKNLILINGLN